MNNRIEELQDFYNKRDINLKQKLDNHVLLERYITMHYLSKYINKNNKIIEIGAGIRNYAIELSKKAKEIVGIDLFEQNVENLNQQNITNLKAEIGDIMNTIILTSYLDFYEKDEQGNKIAHNFGNDNGILDCLKVNIKKYDNFVFVANGMEGEKAEAYFKLACNSFELTLPFKKYDFLCPSAKDRAKELIENADFIFLCGGHLPTQNKFFNDIGLKELLKNTNALIVGGSAGSMNCADVVYCPPELEEEVLDENFNRYLKGLGLTNINIMPHFEEYKQMIICGKRYIDDIVVPDSKKIDIIGLNNGSYIVIKNGTSTIYGESYLIRNEQITQINENEMTITL